jgi:DNA repair exonuclease SbcCD ATPase subunit
MYPGSTIMQNYGESGDKGFLCWDINSKDEWAVDFYPVRNDHPYVTVDWKGNITDTLLECGEACQTGAKFRIRSEKIIDPKTQHKLSGLLRRELNAKEVVYKVDNKSAGPSVATEVTEKLEVLDLSKPSVHKDLLREYASDERFSQKFWDQVDEVIDKTVPHLERSTSLGKRWSIKSLKFENLFAYGSDNSIDFTKTNGLVGLFGPNRAGKSSIPGILTYGLFNSNDRGLSTNAHVVNYRHSAGSAIIDLEVDGADYRIERLSNRYISRKNNTPGAKTVLNLWSLDDDGNPTYDHSGEQRRETEKEVKDLIGGVDEFFMTTFAAQGKMNSFIDMGATDRKKLLSSFMGLDILDDLYKQIKSDGDGIKAMLKKLGTADWDGQIASFEEKISESTTLKESLLIEKNVLATEIKEVENQLKDLTGVTYIDPADIERKEASLEKFRQKLLELEGNIEELEISIDGNQTKLEKYEGLRERIPVESIKRKIDTLESLERSLIKLESTVKREESTLRQQQKSIKLLEEVPCGDSFPSCKFIAESHKNKSRVADQEQLISELREETDNIRNQVEALVSEGLKNKLSKYEKLVDAISSLKVEIARQQTTLASQENSIASINDSIVSLSEQITVMKAQLNGSESNEAKELEDLLNAKNKAFRRLESSIYDTIGKVASFQSRIDRINETKEEYATLQKEWKVYDFLLRATSWRGIPTFVMTKQIPLINAELNKILRDVTGFTVELEVDERSTDIFINYGDTRRPVECGSGMEKMVSSMALRVALANVSNLSKSDMFIIDEGFGALDSENIEAVTNLLQRLKSYYRLILVISHVDVIKDNVDDVIVIERIGHDSKVEY